jgi:hypothetical protein
MSFEYICEILDMLSDFTSLAFLWDEKELGEPPSKEGIQGLKNKRFDPQNHSESHQILLNLVKFTIDKLLGVRTVTGVRVRQYLAEIKQECEIRIPQEGILQDKIKCEFLKATLAADLKKYQDELADELLQTEQVEKVKKAEKKKQPNVKGNMSKSNKQTLVAQPKASADHDDNEKETNNSKDKVIITFSNI